jgi:maltose alpha-D-glucosyltransferase/alpha-amylase
MDYEDALRLRAYYLWEAEGRPDGRAEEHWDQAQREAAFDSDDSQRESTPAELAANDLAAILEPGNITLLENRILPEYLSKRRWFAGKDRSIDSLRVVLPPTVIDDVGLLTQIEINTEKGVERYTLPLAVVWERDPSGGDDMSLARDMAIATVRGEGRTGFLTDAFFFPAFVRHLLATVRDGRSLGNSGDETLDVLLESGARDTIDTSAEIHWLSTEQSNSSVTIGGRIVMKLMRKVQSGIHPEAEMCRFLTRVGYRNSSPLLAEIVLRDREETSRSMFVLQGYVPNEGDAWTYATECLRDALVENADGISTRFEQLTSHVGRRLGELHTALSEGKGSAAFAPEVAQARDIEQWKATAVAQLEQAIEVLERKSAAAEPAEDSLVRRITEEREKICSTIRSAQLSDLNATKTRIHGDFHLGQVLWTGDDVYIIDFEGEPAKSIESRRTKSSAMRDVAGLLRSISYATAFAAKQHGGSSAASADHNLAQLDASRQVAERSFLDAYADAMNMDRLATGEEGTVSLLNLFLIEKAAYEICYEVANRPEWIAIPLKGLARALAVFPELKHLASDGQ